MPVDKDGRQLTKNRKVIMIKGQGPYGSPRAITPVPIKQWKQDCELWVYNKDVQSFLLHYKPKTMIDVRIFWFLKTLRTDPHNYNELLLDGLQIATGINDRYYCVHVDGVQKTPDANTCAHVAMYLHAQKTYTDWMNELLTRSHK